jgi:UDP-2,3-diacylglucosamine pyrophosphatase LpxH
VDARLDDVQAFDELFVVSDLHLGGSPGVQIFHQGARLAATIRALTKRNAGQKLALVIAGDFVDFLAAANPAYLDPENTVKKLEAIKGDKAFAEVFEALAKFVHEPARRLVIVLGNHDVELALPHGREWLYTTLAGTDPAARGRIELALDGWGYPCTVGGRKVLVVHGNEVDDWNVIDHHALLETNRALTRGTALPEWTPNGGTKLVIDLMNAVKARYPMIDLVKPETEAALPIVAALDPENAQLFKFMRAASFKVRDQIKGALGFLGDAPTRGQSQGQVPSDPPTDRELFDRFLAPALAPSARAATSKRSKDDEVAQMLAQANEAIHAGADPRAAGPGEGMLGASDKIQSFFAGSTGQELLRKALKKWLVTDTSYKFWAEDDTFTRLDEAVGSDVEFVIAGHTHLHRAITRKRTKGYYFNSGTWIRLIRLTEHVLDDAEQFARVWEAFSAGHMQALDDLHDLGPDGNEPLVRDISTVVGIHAPTAGVTRTWGQLYVADDEGQLEAVQGSRLPTPIK